jgi:hypothetical protein
MNENKTMSVAAIITGASVPGFAAIFGLWSQNGLSAAAANDPVQVAAFAATHKALYAAMPLLGVAMHLAALLLVIGLSPRLKQWSPLWGGAATALGMSWIFIDLLQNLLHYGLYVGGVSDAAAPAAGRLTEAIWHAGHLGGGVWVAALGLACAQEFGRRWGQASVVVGGAFFLHPFVVPLVPEYFGVEMILVPLWAFWTAARLRREERASPALLPREA